MSEQASKELKPDDRMVEGGALRLLNRSPHPYHRKSVQLLSLAEVSGASSPTASSPLRSTQNTDDESVPHENGKSPYTHSTDSDSGTEADDEHFLKGLPAPKLRAHKGLRHENGFSSGTPSPLMSPDIVLEGERRLSAPHKQAVLSAQRATNEELRQLAERFKRKRNTELRRRACEVLILGVVGAVVLAGEDIKDIVRIWKKELFCELSILTILTITYPVRLIRHLALRTSSWRWPSIQIPAAFDPAPLLYPPALPVFVACLLAKANPGTMILNITLSLSSLPADFVPSIAYAGRFNDVHWLISCIPMLLSANNRPVEDWSKHSASPRIGPETLFYIYPLHQALCVSLNYLTTTSLLIAELQLLSIALINLLLLAVSPQAIILKALLWGGGIGVFITCGRVLSWVVALARVPKWRFRRAKSGSTHSMSHSREVSHLSMLKNTFGITSGNSDYDTGDEEPVGLEKPSNLKLDLRNLNGHAKKNEVNSPVSALESNGITRSQTNALQDLASAPQRRHTLPIIDHSPPRSSKRTPSGRRKRAASSSTKPFFTLTERQATIRKWVYAAYVYVCVVAIILIGIREYVGRHALQDAEPVGWALGYLFGNLPQFRMEVVSNNLERWICLPLRNAEDHAQTCHLGWVEHIRASTFGPANTRLLLLGYWLAIILTGLLIVFRLSAIYEVDTRRKVFHFMMVAMLLPATFVDPTYAALALSLVLAVFLILDLFRASQLPPLSKPLAYFLTPYVDGRDLRGPVVISHIFLLIGCAIPLWLSLGSLERTGTGFLTGWEIPTRDVSMVSGVICVGMGDAAASLIGRRYGRNKWFWAGGKSIEGSLAFAAAVAIGLIIAKVWLIIGGWPDGGSAGFGLWTIWKMILAAVTASLTEALLTGLNDNVAVPVVLWACVKGLKI